MRVGARVGARVGNLSKQKGEAKEKQAGEMWVQVSLHCKSPSLWSFIIEQNGHTIDVYGAHVLV